MSFRQLVITVYEPGGVDRTSFPLTTGSPFGQGELSADESLAMLDDSGRALPLQTRVMETHEDGSVRWLLLDYQADLPALEHTTHTLVTGRKSPESPDGGMIRTAEDGDLLVVENGVLKIEVDRARCRPLLRVWHEGELVSDGGLDFSITGDPPQMFAAHHDISARFEIE